MSQSGNVFVGKLHEKIKDFYVRCIGFLTTVKTKREFEKILYAVLIVALCECDDPGTEYANKQKFFIQVIRNFAVYDMKNGDGERD